MQIVPSIDITYIMAVAGSVCGLMLVLILGMLILFGRRKQMPPPREDDLRIDVSQLPAGGPPADGPVVEFYGMPVRIVALVLAPAGRNSQLPPPDRLPGVLDDLTPGLAAAVSEHRPLIRDWPSQLSTQGFTHAFFNNVQLPGDRGKGTPWCSIAGRFDTGNQQLLAGILCAAQKPNSLGQVAVSNVGQWMETLRIKV